ncbi:TetR family transcriptional regulator [Nocardioides sp. zg-579]|uniref:TetR family transcriptional regulator n=1 Tax=Nocardioides marmotae TaxID=2663857 RepID=A0A6I3IZV0_9ACTN|nr:TetR family transcriptional regulator [Gordonia jinghuaiqii]MTB94687.1 TetR family transcriptional regulator [Nocardioides marmotae]QKE03480.1 TetR family transcriptional regulator [Nocardioides marmotae]
MRRVTGTSTRAAIAEAARRRFQAGGYAATSVRAVAADAGVDAALVIRHFGSKEQLFLETVDVEGAFEQALDGPLDRLGERLVALVLDDRLGRVFRTTYRAMIRATDSDQVRAHLLAAMDATLAAPLAERLSGPDVALRARLVAAQVGGLLEAVAILEDPVVLGAPGEQLVRWYGAAVQALVDGAVPPAAG